MLRVPIFNIDFLQFSCPDTLTNRIVSVIEKGSWKDNIQNKVSESDLFFDTELFDWFESCLRETEKELNFPNNCKLVITSCWANKTTKLQMHHKHFHSNSVISGIFYLTEECAPTQFTYKNYWFTGLSNFLFKQSVPDLNAFVKPKKSTLLLFPSNLMHSVVTEKENTTRYTIAFNTFLGGEYNDGESRCRLDLYPKSVRDHYNET